MGIRTVQARTDNRPSFRPIDESLDDGQDGPTVRDSQGARGREEIVLDVYERASRRRQSLVRQLKRDLTRGKDD